MPDGLDPSRCCNAHVYYSDDVDNFYCKECKKGQGNGYYRKNAPKIGIEVHTYPGTEIASRLLNQDSSLLFLGKN